MWSPSRYNGGLSPQPAGAGIEVGEVQPQIELVLVVVRFHVRAQLVERLVVLLFLHVGGLTPK